MPTLAKWLAEMSDGETIEAVVLGSPSWEISIWDEDDFRHSMPLGKLLSVQEAAAWLDHEFDDGYGSPGCPAVTAWTASWVISVSQYDGSTSPFRLPRNVVAHMPEMPGG